LGLFALWHLNLAGTYLPLTIVISAHESLGDDI